jgi:hypothetical protein
MDGTRQRRHVGTQLTLSSRLRPKDSYYVVVEACIAQTPLFYLSSQAGSVELAIQHPVKNVHRPARLT